MSENLAKGASIVSVMATDRDIGSNAKLTYTLREQDREHFYISSIEATNTGVLKVFKVTQLIDGTKRPLMVWPCRGPIAAVDAVILYIYRKSTCYRLTRIVSQEY